MIDSAAKAAHSLFQQIGRAPWVASIEVGSWLGRPAVILYARNQDWALRWLKLHAKRGGAKWFWSGFPVVVRLLLPLKSEDQERN